VAGGTAGAPLFTAQPAKYVARLRAVNTGARPVLLRTDMDAGHYGADDLARELQFLLGAVPGPP
jgi:protease II